MMNDHPMIMIIHPPFSQQTHYICSYKQSPTEPKPIQSTYKRTPIHSLTQPSTTIKSPTYSSLRTPKSRDRVLSRKIATFEIPRNFFGFCATLILYPSFLRFREFIHFYCYFTGHLTVGLHRHMKMPPAAVMAQEQDHLREPNFRSRKRDNLCFFMLNNKNIAKN